MSATDIAYLPVKSGLRDELQGAGILLPPGVRFGLVNQALDLVAEEYGVTVRQLRGWQKDAHMARARRAAYAALRHIGLSTPVIGRLLRKDHSTVLYGLRKFSAEKLMNHKIGLVHR